MLCFELKFQNLKFISGPRYLNVSAKTALSCRNIGQACYIPYTNHSKQNKYVSQLWIPNSQPRKNSKTPKNSTKPHQHVTNFPLVIYNSDLNGPRKKASIEIVRRKIPARWTYIFVEIWINEVVLGNVNGSAFLKTVFVSKERAVKSSPALLCRGKNRPF